MKVLAPGYYFVELEFDTQVDYGTLRGALEKMGFLQLTPDETAEATIGAIAALSPSGTVTSALRQTTSAYRASPTTTVTAVIKQAQTLTPVGTPPPTTTKPITSTSRLSTAAVPTLRDALAARAEASRSAAAKAFDKGGAGGAARVPAPPPPPAAPADPGYVDPGYVDPGTVQAPIPGEYAAAPGGGGEAYGYGPADGGGEAPAGPPAASFSSVAQDATSRVVDLWRRWREWGSPFATGPTVSGEDLYRFRFVAQLVNPLRIFDKEGMRWLYVRKLGLNPFSDIDFSAKPHRLKRGATYEMRFLSRAKSMPSREAVKKGLTDMGFAPMKLSVMKKNMRVPSRAGTSVTLWYAIGGWERGNSRVTSADPFFFLDLSEVTS